LAFAWPLGLSFANVNDHNVVRVDKESTPRVVDARTAFQSWAMAHSPLAAGTSPMFIVAAEGGGMRANVMTAMVLDELRARYDGFTDHLFAIVGVSGGSLGAASFATAVHEGMPARLAKDTLTPPDPHKRPINWQAALHADLLAPTVRAML